MTIHVDPVTNILRARRRPPQHTAKQRDRLDQAATKLAADLFAAGALRGSFYITIGADELHLYSPPSVMHLARDAGLMCAFPVDWHDLTVSNIADFPHPVQSRLRSEPAANPQGAAGSSLCDVEQIA